MTLPHHTTSLSYQFQTVIYFFPSGQVLQQLLLLAGVSITSDGEIDNNILQVEIFRM